MRKFKCSICGYVYDEAVGIPEKGIAAGTKWEALPEDFVCPLCTAPKSVFKPLEEVPAQTPVPPVPKAAENVHTEGVSELSAGEISAICGSLAKGCEKQRLMDEMDAFNKLAEYYRQRMSAGEPEGLGAAARLLAEDISTGFAAANDAAKAAADRGALRALVWSGKVSAMMNALLTRYAKEGAGMAENTKVYVCDICGFIMVGDAPPEVCPVCKVPSYRIMQVERS